MHYTPPVFTDTYHTVHTGLLPIWYDFLISLPPKTKKKKKAPPPEPHILCDCVRYDFTAVCGRAWVSVKPTPLLFRISTCVCESVCLQHVCEKTVVYVRYVVYAPILKIHRFVWYMCPLYEYSSTLLFIQR